MPTRRVVATGRRRGNSVRPAPGRDRRTQPDAHDPWRRSRGDLPAPHGRGLRSDTRRRAGRPARRHGRPRLHRVGGDGIARSARASGRRHRGPAGAAGPSPRRGGRRGAGRHSSREGRGAGPGGFRGRVRGRGPRRAGAHQEGAVARVRPGGGRHRHRAEQRAAGRRGGRRRQRRARGPALPDVAAGRLRGGRRGQSPAPALRPPARRALEQRVSAGAGRRPGDAGRHRAVRLSPLVLVGSVRAPDRVRRVRAALGSPRVPR